MSIKKTFCAALCALIALSGVFALSCGKTEEKKQSAGSYFTDTEIVELNESFIKILPLGSDEKNLKDAGFAALPGSIDDYLKYYRSKDEQDIVYTVSLPDKNAGESGAKKELVITSIRLNHQGKTIQTNPDGSTTNIYKTDRSILGIKIGDRITDAKKTLLNKQYRPVYEEKVDMNGLPKTYENTFEKGRVYVTLGAERNGEIVQIHIWMPYSNENIAAFNDCSTLPFDIGNIYSMLANDSFQYVNKTNVSMHYASEDGSHAIVRGYPDYADMHTAAEIIFSSNEYDALGAKVGMSEKEAGETLEKAGCVKTEAGEYVFKDTVIISLNSANGTVQTISAALRPSTNLSGIKLEQTPVSAEPTPSDTGANE